MARVFYFLISACRFGLSICVHLRNLWITVVLKKRPRDMGRVFELLTELSDDFMENEREQPTLQEREAF